MKFFILLLLVPIFSLVASPPVPYSGKVSINGVNFSGTTDFVFSIHDGKGTTHWQNGSNERDSIKIVVSNGRYTALLGGQGMNVLPADLFLKQQELYIKVSFRAGDGKGLQHLSPDQRITATPYALSAEWAKFAQSVKAGSITKDMLAPSLQTEISSGGGSTSTSIITTDSDMTLGADSVVLAKNSEKVLNLTLPPASQSIGLKYHIVGRGNQVKIKSSPSEIEGGDYGILHQNQSVEFICLDGQWIVTSGHVSVGINGKVKDINPGFPSSNPENLTNVGGTLYFSAQYQNGNELWKSDGSESGTIRVKDIYSGSSSSNPQYLTNVGGTLYFRAQDQNGSELWKSDGSESGTVRVKDIYPGSDSSIPENLTNVGGTLYFRAQDQNGSELWKSDGSESGTIRVKDIYPGSGSSSPQNLINVGGTLYFRAQDQNGSELWKSDGSESGTVRVKDIYPGSEFK